MVRLSSQVLLPQPANTQSRLASTCTGLLRRPHTVALAGRRPRRILHPSVHPSRPRSVRLLRHRLLEPCRPALGTTPPYRLVAELGRPSRSNRLTGPSFAAHLHDRSATDSPPGQLARQLPAPARCGSRDCGALNLHVGLRRTYIFGSHPGLTGLRRPAVVCHPPALLADRRRRRPRAPQPPRSQRCWGRTRHGRLGSAAIARGAGRHARRRHGRPMEAERAPHHLGRADGSVSYAKPTSQLAWLSAQRQKGEDVEVGGTGEDRH